MIKLLSFVFQLAWQQLCGRGVSIRTSGPAEYARLCSARTVLLCASPIGALWFWEVRWIWKLHGNFLISPLSSDNISPHPSVSLCLVAYLAVKTNDLCTVFTLEFMCYSDKVCGPVCTSAYFMSVYWDRRLPTGGYKTLFRGNAKSHQFPIHSLSPAFPYEWWILSSWIRTTWPFTANNRMQEVCTNKLSQW